MKTKHIHIAANVTAGIFIALLIQQALYCLHTTAWINFSSFTATQIIFEVLYILSIGLVIMSETIKGIAVEPIKYQKPLENTYKEVQISKY